MRSNLLPLLALVVLLLGAISGCGGGFNYTGTDLTGQVTIGGQPVQKGVIQFSPVDGPGTVVSSDIVNGQYSVSRVPVGSVHVLIMATKETGKSVMVQGQPMPEIVSIVPDQYQNGVEQEVKAGDSKLDFSW